MWDFAYKIASWISELTTALQESEIMEWLLPAGAVAIVALVVIKLVWPS